jgi:undecaprenyl-diphosphatase
VCVGAGIGIVSAVATRRPWPVPPKQPAAARAVFDARAGDRSDRGDGVTVVVNPSAGSALGRNPAVLLRDELPDANVVELDEDEDLVEALEKAARDAAILGVCGGDGSVNAAASVAAEHGLPLLVVPGGTLNHFAHDLGIATIADAIAAVREGQLAAVDLGRVAGHPFLNTASFGAYPELVDARERLEHRIGKWPALVVSMGQILRNATPCRVTLDGRSRRIWMIFIGNCRYHPAGFAPSWRERLDDGLLDIRVVDASRPWSRTRFLAAMVSGRLGRCRVYDAWEARSLTVKSEEGPLRLARDGETFDGPVDFRVDAGPRCITVCIPPSPPPPEPSSTG